MLIYLSLFVALIGAIVYGVTEGKLSQLGYGAYCSGLTAFLILVGSRTIAMLR